MSKDSIDYLGLSNTIYKKAYRLSDVPEHRLDKVAFDVVRFKDGDNGAALWQVESNAEGEQYIVALYNDEEENVKTASAEPKTPWQVSLSKIANEIQISYKNDPLLKVAASKLSINPKEISKIPGYLPARLAKNKKLVASLLSELPLTVRTQILRKYPELV